MPDLRGRVARLEAHQAARRAAEQEHCPRRRWNLLNAYVRALAGQDITPWRQRLAETPRLTARPTTPSSRHCDPSEHGAWACCAGRPEPRRSTGGCWRWRSRQDWRPIGRRVGCWPRGWYSQRLMWVDSHLLDPDGIGLTSTRSAGDGLSMDHADEGWCKARLASGQKGRFDPGLPSSASTTRCVVAGRAR
ncbi:MAG: hypothetical protein MZV65_41830 [Chromatiales bacterium]|nr:hypothetical protein [Chromatiales bacterium]